jgi:nitroreductase
MTGMPTAEAVTGRKSVRRFLPDPVSDETIAGILAGASRAASGTTIQPWLAHVVTDAARERLSGAVLAAAEADEASPEYIYTPRDMAEPYLSRRRKVGFDLYALYGVERHDMTGRKAAMLRNYAFFGAPVGLFFTMDRAQSQGAWLDCGMFMANVMTLARAQGLDTCPQQAWCDFGGVVHRELAIPENHILLSGMALGRADWSARENALVADRAPVEDFTTWHR